MEATRCLVGHIIRGIFCLADFFTLRVTRRYLLADFGLNLAFFEQRQVPLPFTSSNTIFLLFPLKILRKIKFPITEFQRIGIYFLRL